jgi:hypothetical protein
MISEGRRPGYLKSMENIFRAEYTDQKACSQARSRMKEAPEFPDGWNEAIKKHEKPRVSSLKPGAAAYPF